MINQLSEHPNFDLSGGWFPIAETENYVSYFVYFSDLKTVYSYFITIILIKIEYFLLGKVVLGFNVLGYANSHFYIIVTV